LFLFFQEKRKARRRFHATDASVSRKEAKEQSTNMLSAPAPTLRIVQVIRRKKDHPVRHSCAGRNLFIS